MAVVSSISSTALSCHGSQVKVVGLAGPLPRPSAVNTTCRGRSGVYSGHRGVVPVAADATGLLALRTVKERRWQHTRHVASLGGRRDHVHMTALLVLKGRPRARGTTPLLLRVSGDDGQKRSVSVSASPLRWSARTPVKAKAKFSEEDSSDGKKEGGRDGSGTSRIDNAVVIAGGLISLPVVAWSLFTLKTTGCGLPPGPGGSLGALEGISYLVVIGIAGWSLIEKLKGTPTENGVANVVATLSYLTLLAGALVFGLQLLDYGYIPPPVPGEQCFG
eukprot:TRINITY_DN5861_c0_g1_i1.p1 TRINITY_DN5861_c0_g1~~TRINITY_DN5861_c0_g1_i1.p1  ORF type:complete len:285 (-),score=25.95 TRINITY_DN5861_c0_g1_i1:396-1223(-)